jgi:hypothetical protein
MVGTAIIDFVPVTRKVAMAVALRLKKDVNPV